MNALPGSHPVLSDEPLRASLAAAVELCEEQHVVVQELTPLRYMPGRRFTALIESPDRKVVLKVFSSPRARGNDRRLRILRLTSAAGVLPEPLAVHGNGRVGFVSFTPGVMLDLINDHLFLVACRSTGAALHLLHTSGAILDRSWTLNDELEQLKRRAPVSTSALVDAVSATALSVGLDHLVVPSHRDFHPRQVVVIEPVADGSVVLIDLDDAAMAPAGLDVGNMIAHLRREELMGRRSATIVEAGIAEFAAGYGELPAHVGMWEQLSLARLAGLAETRHHDVHQRDELVSLMARRATGEVIGHADRPVRIERHGSNAVVVKRFTNGNGNAVFAEMEELWASSFGSSRVAHGPANPGMPQPLSFDAATGDLRMKLIAGPAMGRRGAIGVSIDRGAEAGELLAALHESGVRPTRLRGPSQICRSITRKAADLQGTKVGDRLRDVATRLPVQWLAAPHEEAVDFVPTHGDFSPRNVLISRDGLRVIDFDRLQLAHPARDVAYWAAWLWATQLTIGEQPSWEAAQSFIDGYASVTGQGPREWGREYDFQRCAALARIAHGWSALRRDESSAVAILDEALRLVTESTVPP